MIRVDAALALGGFDLDIAFENDVGITALFGRSGSGKSTTINLIAGLGGPIAARIVLDGRALVHTETGAYVPKYRRRVGLVFQDSPALPASQRAAEFSVRAMVRAEGRGTDVFDSRPWSRRWASALCLARKPARLSGGEKQRVALGRALLASPEDPADGRAARLARSGSGSSKSCRLIEPLRDEFRIPIVYVSHSVEEVGRLASRVVVLESGRVVAVGGVEEVLGAGLSAAGISRFARSSVIAGKLTGIDEAYGLTEIAHPAGTIWLVGRAGPIGGEARVVIKSTDITLAKSRRGDERAHHALRQGDRHRRSR